ncbi:MAG: methylmalonyl-CoA mutase family protein [Candidatus Limnocylindrales bacterium]|nr:methylmalonyl-CoA mutase family protein [Candidatus Limnocylindrales bacterium]
MANVNETRGDSPSDALAEAETEWRVGKLAADHARIPPRRTEFTTLSGLDIKDLYTPRDIASIDPLADIGLPGRYPFTRGVRASMYRGRPWTIRQVAGFGQAEDTNARYRYLLGHGETGLSTDFDLPTLLGHDSDHPVFSREVGKIGVAVDSVEDAHALFAGIPLDEISTSLTINASAAVLLAMYRVVGDERGIAGDRLTGTIQNDILKEYTAQNEYIYPPDPSVRLVVDSMAYCAEVMPRFNPVSVSGYHIREAGATAPEEVGLTLSAALTYLERARERGIEPDSVAPRLSFFFDVHNDFLEEIAKLRAARRLWARLTRERLGCRRPESWLLRVHAQTAGVTLTAQQPLNNVARVTVQALAAVLGGVQSLHTNSLDEAYAIPSEQAIKVAVRTQQILLHETGVGDVVDPLAGSYYIERLTTDIEDEARALIERIDGLGGLIAAITSGYAGQLIANSSWEQQRAIESGERTVVGVNAYADETPDGPDIATFALDPGVLERQLARLARTRASRESRRAGDALREVRRLADVPEANLMPAIEEAVRARCTVGEICNVLRDAWGEYRPPTTF